MHPTREAAARHLPMPGSFAPITQAGFEGPSAPKGAMHRLWRVRSDGLRACCDPFEAWLRSPQHRDRRASTIASVSLGVVIVLAEFVF
jgi:hypothetical protein